MDAGNTTSQNVTGLNSGTSYYYRVRAYNSSSTSGNSGTTTTTTLSRIISLSGNLAFGSVTIGSSPQNALTIYNNGNSTMTVSSISCPSGFSVNWSGTIVAGGSQPVTVTFSPTSAISYGGTATVYSDMTSGVNTIAASGTGTTTPTRIISLNGNLAFGNVTVNSSAQSTLTINNTGNSTMTVSSISYPSGFSGNWSGAIPAGNSQNVTVTFSPISATSYGGTVTVNSDMNGGVNTISASGTGTVLPTPILSLSGNLTFGNVTVGTSTQNTLTISNIGNSTMTVSNINYPSGFGGNWSGAISAGNSQNVTVTFSPTSATSYGGTVTVNSDAASGGNTIIASGTGVVIPTTTPQITNVVFSGSAGNYTITVTGWGLGSLTGLPIMAPQQTLVSWISHRLDTLNGVILEMVITLHTNHGRIINFK